MSVASPQTPDTAEILDVLGPCIQFLTALSDNDNDYCVIRATVAAGVAVPLHSHAERETFYVLEGEIQGFWEDHWITLSPGDVLDVPGRLKHGWRNVTGASVSVLIVAPMRLGRFLRDIGRPAETAGAPTLADFQRLQELAFAYDYWLGTPADNTAVGISF
jgi:quercetin dioxygenase-like cupin family protein